MGVLGLWQLLAPVGQPVTLESLENKIFAVDISIWLNQAVKGYRDAQGGSVPNAHLLSLFSRLCKLLFYKIRPIIVFDGGYPELKKQTIINRQQRRAAVKQNSREVGLKILTNYLASQQLKRANDGSTSSKVSIKVKEKARDEIFKLPPLPECSQTSTAESYEPDDDIERKFTNFTKEDLKYLRQIDIESEDFNALPPDVKQEILSSLKESNKHRTWDQHEALPKESNDFSKYQMECLLKKRKVQSKLEEVQKHIRQVNSSAYVSQYTSDHVIGETNKIMSDDSSYYVLLKKIIDQKGDSSKSSEDIKASTSFMAETKNAFIRDVENIDVDDDSFLEDSNTLKKGDEVNQRETKIKVEDFSFNSSEEEYDVDNPPLIESDKSFENALKKHEKEIKVNKPDFEVKKSSLNLSDEECIVDDTSLMPSKENNIDQNHIDSENSAQVQNIHQKDVNQEQDTVINVENKSTVIYNDQTLIASEQNVNQMQPARNEINVETKNLSVISDNEAKIMHDKNESVSPINMNDMPSSEFYKLSADENLNTTLKVNNNNNSKLSTEAKSSISSETLNDEEMEYKPNVVKKNVEQDCIENESLKDYVDEALQSDTPSQSSDSELIFSEEVDEDLRERNIELQEDLYAAASLLEAERAKQDRQSRSVQEHMIEECKELLQLFGIPFVVSPLEAEAQCAFYDLVDFTHGTITDDSDVWLFGGKRVYKNFFAQQKFVEFYRDKEIFTHFGLSRKKLVNFALLTGSDYTVGIEGVGPVTAMEIISEFPGEGIDALQKFKDWWVESNKHARPPENKVRAKLLKLVLAETFPSEEVTDAYLNPEVNDSMEKFTWGRPDLDALRDYTKERFGWNQSKVDSTLVPVLKKLNERDKQMHIDSYFSVTLRKQANLFPSKRIMSALKKMTSKEDQSDDCPQGKTTKRKARVTGKKAVPRKVVKQISSTRGRGGKKSSKSQRSVLSESSSDSDS